MCEEGLFDLFPVEAVYGMHNQPGLPLGKFGVRVGLVNGLRRHVRDYDQG